MSHPAIQRIVPSLWFNRNAQEGANFHIDAFQSALGPHAVTPSSTGITHISHYPTKGLPDFQKDFAGEVLEVRYSICGFELSAINSDDSFTMDPSISLAVVIDPSIVDQAEERIHALHSALIAGGGRDLMPLGEYPFSPLYTWVQDRYGMTWQLSLPFAGEVVANAAANHPDPAHTAPSALAPVKIIPTLLFPAHRSHGAEALQRWSEVFDAAFGNSALGVLSFQSDHTAGDEGTPLGDSNALLYGSTLLAGTTIAAMENPGQQDFTFSCALSFQIMCDTQEQIDLVWEGLSAVPEAEICGWLQDRFGVSWQVCPSNITELMSRPGAFEAMATMKKPLLATYDALPST
ncbi:MAG: VOC family protein [Actinomycetaceae bacterium]|nr:VOC family protein [Actinomycetaceae bacterium]